MKNRCSLYKEISASHPDPKDNTMPTSVLIIDDEQDLLNTMEYNLRREGFETHIATTGGSALITMNDSNPFDLIILDLMLPDMSGTEVCRVLRSKSHTREVPLIMLTARGDEIDRVVGLEMGADDYVVKPFSIRELLLRMRAVLRRKRRIPMAMEENEIMIFGNLKVDIVSHRVWVENEEIRLTALEFRLLTTFIGRKGRVQDRETLLSDVWGIHANVTTRTVDTHVKRLREKLKHSGQYIETLRGVGYRFSSTPQESLNTHSFATTA
jgi:two-component system phosphate regulon response regulator PhoB